MKTLSKIKNIVTRACVIYTVLITSVYLLGVSVSSDWIPTLNMVLALLVFSFCLSGLHGFLFSSLLVFPLRLVIHYVISTIVFYIVFVCWGGYRANGGSVLSVLLVWTFAYILCAVCVFLYRYITSETKSSESKYDKKFDGRDGDYKSQFSGK